MENKIFLSYAYEDIAWVSEFVKVLNSNGVDVWFDMANIKLGDSFQDAIADALRNSTVMILIVSQKSVKSPWIFFELGAAVADNKRIIPVVIDDTEVAEIPVALAKYQFLKTASVQEAGEIVTKALSN